MYKAKLYNKSNIFQKSEAMQCLEEYGKQIKWKNDRFSVIDIGCGDGGLTMGVLKKFIPNNCERLVGLDISENMIEFANKHYANDHTSFIVQDIEGDLPNELRGIFDCAFSFFALHWIQQPEVAFTNIYDMLSEGGECFLVFLNYTPNFDVFRTLSRSTKWKFWLKDAERFISPFHDCQDPEKVIKPMMTSIGFTSVDVKCLRKPFTFPSLDAFKDHVTSVTPFKIPKDLMEDYVEDFLNVLRDMGVIDPESNNDDGPKINYRIIVAMGRKSSMTK